MATVVFLQRDAIEWLGVMYLSGMLKKHGHTTAVVVDELEPTGCIRPALEQDADLYAFSPLVTDIRWALEQASALKEAGRAMVAFGGTHVTLNADETIAHPAVDIVCRGEGEHPLLELADALDRGADPGAIPNLWVQNENLVRRNELRHLVEDLDSLPFPDRALYTGYAALRSTGKRPLHIGRGCPYGCSYCHNVSKQELMAHKGRYVRWRSVDNVLAEVEALARTTYLRVLHFVDDGFGLNTGWLEAFLPRLAELLPQRPAIFANMRADRVTEPLCSAFEVYGSDRMRLRIAVECGDERYRREVLQKTISDADLRRAASLLHHHNIPFSTYNMVGLPGESYAQAIATLRLNVELRPERAYCFIYQPFPGTKLAQLALTSGAIDAEALAGAGAEGFRGYFESFSPLQQRNIVQLENLQRLFALVVKLPILFPLARRLATATWMAPLLRLAYQLHLRLTVRRRRRVDSY